MTRASATAMTRLRTRSLRTGLVLAGALALATPLAAGAAAPQTYMGQPVHEMPIPTPDGQTIVLHATDSGFIPEESDHLAFIGAGPAFRRGSKGEGPGYRWSFTLELKGQARPTRVLLEELTSQGWTLQTDDTEPSIIERGTRAWTGDGTTCTITRDQPCSAWLYRDKTEAFVFRATVTFDDGSTEVLHQGASFNTGTMGPLLKSLGVER